MPLYLYLGHNIFWEKLTRTKIQERDLQLHIFKFITKIAIISQPALIKSGKMRITDNSLPRSFSLKLINPFKLEILISGTYLNHVVLCVNVKI